MPPDDEYGNYRSKYDNKYLIDKLSNYDIKLDQEVMREFIKQAMSIPEEYTTKSGQITPRIRPEDDKNEMKASIRTKLIKLHGDISILIMDGKYTLTGKKYTKNQVLGYIEELLDGTVPITQLDLKRLNELSVYINKKGK